MLYPIALKFGTQKGSKVAHLGSKFGCNTQTFVTLKEIELKHEDTAKNPIIMHFRDLLKS